MKKAIAMGLMGMGSVLGVWAACNSPNNIQVTVEITAPTVGQKLTMSAVNAAFTTLTAASSGDDDDLLAWTFAGFVFPAGDDGNKGTPVDVKTPATWPTDNSFWGEKTVELEYSGGDEGDTRDCHDEVDVKVFFEPTVEVHNTHAWYYYFKQAAVWPLTEFTPLKGDDPIWDDTHFGNDANGFYKVRIIVTVPVKRLAVDSATLYINTSHYQGINEVGRIVAHEYTHRRLCENLEQKYEQIQDKWVAGKIDYSEYSSQMIAVDVDKDWVADSEDPNIGAKSHEALAVAWAATHALSMIDDKDADWSEGGHNYVQ